MARLDEASTQLTTPVPSGRWTRLIFILGFLGILVHDFTYLHLYLRFKFFSDPWNILTDMAFLMGVFFPRRILRLFHDPVLGFGWSRMTITGYSYEPFFPRDAIGCIGVMLWWLTWLPGMIHWVVDYASRDSGGQYRGIQRTSAVKMTLICDFLFCSVTPAIYSLALYKSNGTRLLSWAQWLG
ncbi:hypothetical protein F4677DRAFT_420962 [Hypoxylon crocopeplum]|nr:hypothetical protein F4677DRAFT_420962 [Hypoxylon crocopeplum]